MTNDDPLWFDRDTMAALGARVAEMLADWLAGAEYAPVLQTASVDEMRHLLHEPAPRGPMPPGDVLTSVFRDILPYAARSDHPRFLAYIPSCSTWMSALGDFIASGANVYAGSWLEAAGPSQVELTVLDWFREWLGYPDVAAGVLVSGGSAANLMALACARESSVGEMNDHVVVYVSDQAHSSLARAARLLGFRSDQVRVLPVDDAFRMRVDVLTAAMAADRSAGHVPLFVAASAGSTNTGAIDPLPELADACAEQGAWFHVDAAYGGFAALTRRGKQRLAGVDRADSVTLDPHKWLYQPFECGCLMVRDGTQLERAFAILPDYLRDSQGAAGEVNFSDRGLQLSRSFRALKVWMSVKTFGTDAFAAEIDRCLDLAQHAQRMIEADERLELLSAAQLGIVCFRRTFEEDTSETEVARRNAALVQGLARSGDAFLSSTRLRGRYAVRMCILNHTTSPADIECVLDLIARSPVPQSSTAVGFERNPTAGAGWTDRLAPPDADASVQPSQLGDLEALADLTLEELELIASHVVIRRAAAGETIIQEWYGGRDFYIILGGEVDVTQAGTLVATLGRGQFFGEFAALDWGAGYGYARQATVTARTDLSLMAIPQLERVIQSVPLLGERIRSTALRRLGGG